MYHAMLRLIVVDVPLLVNRVQVQCGGSVRWVSALDRFPLHSQSDLCGSLRCPVIFQTLTATCCDSFVGGAREFKYIILYPGNSCR